jgi:hypothetical protein
MSARVRLAASAIALLTALAVPAVPRAAVADLPGMIDHADPCPGSSQDGKDM